jgi:hypothetical protein
MNDSPTHKTKQVETWPRKVIFGRIAIWPNARGRLVVSLCLNLTPLRLKIKATKRQFLPSSKHGLKYERFEAKYINIQFWSIGREMGKW